MTEPSETVVHRTITVNAPVDRAFAVFTERFGDFKPLEHNLFAVPIAETVFEPRVGGHIMDRGDDGSECRWARIRPHGGATTLDMTGRLPDQMTGAYWTDRLTAGDMTLTRLTRDTGFNTLDEVNEAFPRS